jgi:hypothetical protein
MAPQDQDLIYAVHSNIIPRNDTRKRCFRQIAIQYPNGHVTGMREVKQQTDKRSAPVMTLSMKTVGNSLDNSLRSTIGWVCVVSWQSIEMPWFVDQCGNVQRCVACRICNIEIGARG